MKKIFISMIVLLTLFSSCTPEPICYITNDYNEDLFLKVTSNEGEEIRELPKNTKIDLGIYYKNIKALEIVSESGIKDRGYNVVGTYMSYTVTECYNQDYIIKNLVPADVMSEGITITMKIRGRFEDTEMIIPAGYFDTIHSYGCPSFNITGSDKYAIKPHTNDKEIAIY